jgi:uncharacterized protein YbjT (DUF2867 family)
MILVSGATGNVGGELVRILAESGEQVRALTRGKGDFPPGVAPVAGDLNQPESLRDALAGVQGMFLLSGYQDMPGLLAEVQDAGIEHVVLLSGGSAANGDVGNAVSRYMIASETAIRDSGVPWTILRPNAFMSNALRWLPQLQAGNVVRGEFPDVPAATIDPYDIAAVAALALRAPGHAGETYAITGPESLLPADRVRILGEVLGRDLTFEGLSNDEARVQMGAAMPVEYVDAFFSFYVDGTLDESKVLSTVQDLLSRPPHTFHHWATTHSPAFTALRRRR